jgi:GcrA cell cycle regulator
MARGDTEQLGWTDQRIERLLELDRDGLSATAIAAELGGGVSRNAVIGKLHRLQGESRRTPRPTGQQNQRRSTKRAAEPVSSIPPVQAVGAPEAKPKPGPPTGPGVDILALREIETGRQCRFILGRTDAGRDGTFYCAETTEEPGASYCPYHAARCFDRTRALKRISAPGNGRQPAAELRVAL